MKNKRGIYILALILSLASVVLLSMYIQGLKKAPDPVVQLDKVVVAVADIPVQTVITEDMLEIQALPKEAIHPLAARTKEELVGAISIVEVSAKEQFLKNKVAEDDMNLSLSFRVPENMRAIAVPMNEILGVAGYVEKNDRVDLLISYDMTLAEEDAPPADEENQDETTPPGDTEKESGLVTITQMQNLEVLEVGPLSISEEGIVQKNRGVTTSVVLLVKPEQAEMIAYAIQSGVIQLSLRNPLDQEILAPSQFNQQNFDEWRTR